MSISEATLFVASNSNASIQTLNFVKKTKLPVQIVRLDTVEARQQAANGKHFQIVSVPTMVISYEDGNTQLFLGLPKITQWLTALIKTKEEENARREPIEPTNMYEDEYVPADYPARDARERTYAVQPRYTPSTVKVRRSKDSDEDMRRTMSRSIPKDIPVDNGDDIMIMEEEEPEPVIQKPKSRKKKGRKPVQEELEFMEEDEQINPIKLAKKKLNEASSSKSKPQSSKMKGVYNAAKAMEQDMKNSLGYKEEDLPHY